MSRTDLQANTRKQLAEIARDNQIPGWHAMRKDQLVEVLAGVARRRRNRKNGAANGNGASNGSKRAAHAHRNGRPVSAPCRLSATHRVNAGESPVRDQLSVEARGPFWLHARWTLTSGMLNRAEAAMDVEWRQAVPVLRVFDVTDGEGTATTKTLVKEAEINADIDHWYLSVLQPGCTCRVQLAYRAPSGNVFVLACSDELRMPQAANQSRSGESGRAGRNGGATPRNDGRTRPSNSPVVEPSDFDFRIDAEVIVYGQTHPRADLTLAGKPMQQEEDGSFTLRLALEEGRQLIPVVCITPDGKERRTIALAIERNTKHLEPQPLDELV